MSKTFTSLLDDIETTLSDTANTFFSRNALIMWAKEAMLALPILRPMRQTYAVVSAGNTVDLSDDFREIISIEYPINEDPPSFLIRLNRFDPNFWASADHYDYDFNYSVGKGWTLYVSFDFTPSTSVYINYLSNHDITVTDNSSDEISVNDEHTPILVAFVVHRALVERLMQYSHTGQTYSQTIYHLNRSIELAFAYYKHLVDAATSKLAFSRPTPSLKFDPYDRVY